MYLLLQPLWVFTLLHQFSNPAKTAFKKIGALICSMSFLSPEVVLYLYESTIQPWMKYCCHLWAGTPSCYFESSISYKNGHAGLLVFHLLLLLNPPLSSKCSHIHVQNILRLFDGWSNFLCITSETKPDFSNKLVYTSYQTTRDLGS